ncbi:hypothetical protein F5Y03DRAFT_392393 [Xylaria venustula]|nr:hypothetical protein F5Y03DRAFT_392393 [Xylaria venustula]
MEGLIKIISKGVMMGAAIMFTAIHREHTIYNCVTLSLFILGTVAHVVTSLSVTTLILYIVLAVSLPSVAIVVLQPQFITVPGYAPVAVAFMLWIVEDCSHLHLRTPSLLSWWPEGTYSELRTKSASPTVVCDSLSRFPASVVPEYTVDDDESAMSVRDSLLFRYIWSPSQSCVPSSRLSDISLSSSGLDSLPCSWGTLTRLWFPEFPGRGRDFDEPDHAGCQRARTV